jgi:Fe-S oxidoreductase
MNFVSNASHDEYRGFERSKKKLLPACPHCFNTLKNEYPELGGTYEVIHHTEF